MFAEAGTAEGVMTYRTSNKTHHARERGVGGDTREGRTPSVFLTRHFPNRNHTCERTFDIYSDFIKSEYISNVRLNDNPNTTNRKEVRYSEKYEYFLWKEKENLIV